MQTKQEKYQVAIQRILNKSRDELTPLQLMHLDSICEQLGLGICDNCGRVKRLLGANYIVGWWCHDCIQAEADPL
jgi:hypothetical protein